MGEFSYFHLECNPHSSIVAKGCFGLSKRKQACYCMYSFIINIYSAQHPVLCTVLYTGDIEVTKKSSRAYLLVATLLSTSRDLTQLILIKTCGRCYNPRFIDKETEALRICITCGNNTYPCRRFLTILYPACG